MGRVHNAQGVLCFIITVNDRDSFVGLEGICTVVEHLFCLSLDDGLGLDV
jgi:hypothetical protein